MGRLTEVMRRVFKRKSPELYDALRRYCEKKGVKIEDALNSAVALYLNADEEGRKELEDAFAEIRRMRSSGGGFGNVKEFVEAIKAVGDLMTTVQSTAHSLVKNSLLTEVKNQMELAKSIASMGQEGGKGSLEDLLATTILSNVLGLPIRKQQTKSTGKGKVEEIGE